MGGHSPGWRQIGRFDGVTVTARNLETGRRHTFAVAGRRDEALEIVVDALDRASGDWRVLCLSTPQTIASDLYGGRRGQASPERQALERIDRLDLLDPSVRR